MGQIKCSYDIAYLLAIGLDMGHIYIILNICHVTRVILSTVRLCIETIDIQTLICVRLNEMNNAEVEFIEAPLSVLINATA